jgi:hypothetical protein
MIWPRRFSSCVGLVAVAALAWAPAPGRAADGDEAFAVTVDSPTAKLGQPAAIVATLTARNGYRITESYRHRIVNIVAIDDGVEVARKVVRGSVNEGQVVFRIEVQPKTIGPHIVAGVLRFSINNGTRLDIKAAPFEATVTVTE